MIDPLTREPIGDPDVLYEKFYRHMERCPACAETPCNVALSLGRSWYRAERLMAEADAEIDTRVTERDDT